MFFEINSFNSYDLNKNKENLRSLRNDIVGSVENKIEFLRNNSLKE